MFPHQIVCCVSAGGGSHHLCLAVYAQSTRVVVQSPSHEPCLVREALVERRRELVETPDGVSVRAWHVCLERDCGCAAGEFAVADDGDVVSVSIAHSDIAPIRGDNEATRLKLWVPDN